MKYSAYLLFIASMISCAPEKHEPIHANGIPSSGKMEILLQPWGKVDELYLKSCQSALEKNYPAKVTIAEMKPAPSSARSSYSNSRLRADSLLQIMDRERMEPYHKVIGITAMDISCTKNKEPKWKYKDWGVFGLGYCPGSTCVVSYYRLGARGAGEQLKLERFRKVCVHELGHTLGLPHCKTKGCVMSDAAETILTIDGETEDLCSHCKEQLKQH